VAAGKRGGPTMPGGGKRGSTKRGRKTLVIRVCPSSDKYKGQPGSFDYPKRKWGGPPSPQKGQKFGMETRPLTGGKSPDQRVATWKLIRTVEDQDRDGEQP